MFKTQHGKVYFVKSQTVDNGGWGGEMDVIMILARPASGMFLKENFGAYGRDIF